MSQAAEHLRDIHLSAELEFYKALSLDYGQILEGIADCLADGTPISIAIGRKPPVRGVRKRGNR